MRVRHGVTLMTGILLAAAAAAPAISAGPPEPIQTAIENAGRIVRASAVADSSFLLPRASKTAPREVRTDWKIEVRESWKGPMERTVPLTLRVKGGRIGGVSERVEGEPEIIRGGEYLFFLRADSTTGRWRRWCATRSSASSSSRT